MGIVRASDDSCNNAAERARGQCRRGGGIGRAGLVRGHGLGPSVVAAAGRRRPSTFALVGATGKRNLRGRRHGESTRLAFGVVLAGAHEAPGGMAGRRRHAPLRSCSMAGELARVTTRGAREASVRALARCAAAVRAIPACQDRHGRWPGHREPPWILASRCTAGCAGASPGHGRAWQGLAGRPWARRAGRRTHRPIDALRSHQTSGDELARPPHEPTCSDPPTMARVPVQDGTHGYASAHQPRARRRRAGPSRALLGVVISLVRGWY